MLPDMARSLLSQSRLRSSNYEEFSRWLAEYRIPGQEYSTIEVTRAIDPVLRFALKVSLFGCFKARVGYYYQ